jgi:pimeloyl-ACP methyl ester carboxylesterase
MNLSPKIAQVLQKRLELANAQYNERVKTAYEKCQPIAPVTPWDYWSYAVDFAQRSVLFWDAMRERGNQFIEREKQGLPPVLHFPFEMVMDGRQFDRPVNYALVRILPPEGVSVDDRRRPYIIIDPRAGHGPGIGGFKDDSQVGVALREGHPVYFVIFFPEPQPGQTLLDVCAAERKFVRRVRELHTDAPKPALVGNCQGGWAAMMLASSSPEDTGPIVINGAPMSYWGGAWSEGEGDNPMRYSGGLLGGTWLASLTSDLGAGKFDGAHLVQNFENLNPANTFWDKYYHLFANADTEPARFLDFERWWGGFYLMNRAEIEWITKNLFVGNNVWKGGGFDLREIKVPIVLFASMGDNITPPQQAFNWVADVYGSTEEIKARGQVIVGLVHESIGHLGIFVSGKVAKKEHAQIVSVLKSIEALPPGLYAMRVEGDQVSFTERRLEEITERLNRFKRADEKPFEAVAAVSDFNQRAYELFARPAVQALASEQGAQLSRDFHPLRFQRWALSDRNPWLAWVKPAAELVKAQRQALPADAPARKGEKLLAECTSASLDYYRAVRDALSEAAFFQIYGNLFALGAGEQRRDDAAGKALVDAAIASVAKGGYPAALARVAFLLARKGKALPLSRFEIKQQLMKDYAKFLPDLPRDEARRIRGEQEVIVAHDLERAIATLADLLANPADRQKLLTLLERLLADPRVQSAGASEQQLAMLERIRTVLGAPVTA